MKKRMWLWCMIAAVGLAFNVACSDDDENVTPEPPQTQPGNTQEPEPPVVVVVDTMEVLTSEIEVVAEGQEISFVTRTNVEYEVAADAEWITVTSEGRALTADYTVTATVAANNGEAREGNITVTFKDEDNTAKTVVVKQAAYQAPEDTPVPPVTEYETVTVTLDIVPGAAGTTVSAEEVAAKLGVADLAAALADGTVTYAGLNADGSVYTAEDGTVPAFTTNGPYGHWYNSEGNPIVWGTPDPNETGAVRFAYIEGDGVTYTLGYDNSSSLTPGSYAIAGLYTNGDTKVKFEVAINVGEAPEIDFEAPVADYVLEVDVAQDNGYGATYIALDGTEFGYWGAYSDPEKYMTTIEDVSVDITGEIEAKLGLEEGALEDALYGGDVLLGAYGLDGEGNKYFRDAYTETGSNYFYWYTVEGVAVGWGQNSVFCIDNIGFHDGTPQLYGTTCMFPTDAQIGTTYSAYIVFKNADETGEEYVVEVRGTAVAAPEKQPLKEYTVVETYEKTYATVNPAAYNTPDPMFSNEDIITDIQSLIGGEVSQVLMSYVDDNLETAFQEWTVTDGWFAAEGAAGWGSQTVMFCLKPNTDGTFSYCAAINDGAVDAAVTFRYCNDTELKAVDVNVTVTLTAPEA